jgi:hypothetical protein
MLSRRQAFAASLIAFLAAPGVSAQAQTVVDRVLATIPTPPIAFVAIAPCRLADTRPTGPFSGPFGPPSLVASTPRMFPVAGNCGVPLTAQAVSMNMTVTLTSGAGHFSIWPDGSPQPSPLVSTLNYVAGQTVANNVLTGLGKTGGINVYSLLSVDLVIDVNGYFIDAIAGRPIRVTPNTLGVWEAWNDLCGLATIEFTNGEMMAPPLGTGSFQVTATDSANGGALSTNAYTGTLVSALSALRYSTKSEDATDHPYMYLNLDDNNDGVRDRTIYFIPANNQAGEGASKANLWQTWNAFGGLWNEGGDTGPGGAVPLSTFGTAHILGIRIASGCGPDTGGVPRARNTDDFEIAVGGASPTIYDFERN